MLLKLRQIAMNKNGGNLLAHTVCIFINISFTDRSECITALHILAGVFSPSNFTLTACVGRNIPQNPSG